MQEHLANLPHGPEFRFVDSLTHLDPGVSAIATYTLQGSEAFLAGHFPDQPIMPGVLMVEAIAQLAGVVAQCDPAHPVLHNMRLTAVRGAKILGTFGPGTTATLTANVQGRMGSLIQAEGSISVAGQEIFKTQITLSGDANPTL
jgi:3-hydroxyacyl-[acyl-carrier-protein] dehydratase